MTPKFVWHGNMNDLSGMAEFTINDLTGRHPFDSYKLANNVFFLLKLAYDCGVIDGHKKMETAINTAITHLHGDTNFTY